MARLSGMGLGPDLSGPAVIDDTAKIDTLSTFGDHSYVGTG